MDVRMAGRLNFGDQPISSFCSERYSVKSLIAAVLLWMTVSVCQADILIEVESRLLPYTSTGLVDIYASSSNDNVQSFGLKLQISGGSVDGSLTFVDPQTYDSQSHPDYIFSGNTDPSGWGSTVGVDFLTLTLGDFTLDGTDYNLTGRKLLARVQVQHTTADPGQTVDDVYTISVVDDGSTFFSDVAINFANFTSSAGNLTVITPEPSTVGLLAVCGVGLFWRLRRSGHSRHVVK